MLLFVVIITKVCFTQTRIIKSLIPLQKEHFILMRPKVTYIGIQMENMLVYMNEEGVKQGINPFDHGAAYTDIMKTQALKKLFDRASKTLCGTKSFFKCINDIVYRGVGGKFIWIDF